MPALHPPDIEREILQHEYAAKALRRRLAALAGRPVRSPGKAKAPPPVGMSAESLMTRKRFAGFSDLQVLTLFSLARLNLLTLSDLAEELAVGASTAWHAAEAMIDQGLVGKDTLNRPFSVAFFFLTDEGKRKLAWLLGRAEPAGKQ